MKTLFLVVFINVTTVDGLVVAFYAAIAMCVSRTEVMAQLMSIDDAIPVDSDLVSGHAPIDPAYRVTLSVRTQGVKGSSSAADCSG